MRRVASAFVRSVQILDALLMPCLGVDAAALFRLIFARAFVLPLPRVLRCYAVVYDIVLLICVAFCWFTRSAVLFAAVALLRNVIAG